MNTDTMFTLAQAAEWVPGARLVGDGATPIARVHTDTRTLAAGDLFVALRGERFDAHDFIAQARDAGASAVIAERGKLGEAANGAGQLHACSASAHDHKGQQSLAFGWIAFALGALKCEQHTAANGGGVFQRFQAWGVFGPFIVAKVGMRGAGGQNQCVI